MATLSLYYEDKPLRPDINNPGRDRYLGSDLTKDFTYFC